MKKLDFNKILDLVYVDKCALCRKPCSDILCPDCLKNLKVLSSFCCPKCGKPLGSCICSDISPKFERCISAFCFENTAVSALIYKFKYSGNKKIGNMFANKLADRVFTEFSSVKFDYVTYVPASALDVARKGFDHARLIAKNISGLINVPFVNPPIKKKGFIKQKHQNLKYRQKNASKRFSLRLKQHIFGTVLLVDDVVTSGGTINTCSALLKAAGADKVYCISVATSEKKQKKSD